MDCADFSCLKTMLDNNEKHPACTIPCTNKYETHWVIMTYVTCNVFYTLRKKCVTNLITPCALFSPTFLP